MGVTPATNKPHQKRWDEIEAYEILELLEIQQKVFPETTVHDLIYEILEDKPLWCDSCRCMHYPDECFTEMN
tara:strand:- start:967 stop:1182 length:216 start_codon:yes stop_codon:yes gene_type:complete